MWNLLNGMSVAERPSRRGGNRPTLLPADQIRSHHRLLLVRHKTVAAASKSEFALKLTMSKTSPITSSNVAFDRLERVDVSQLCLEMSAAGKYVLVRCIEEGINVKGWHTIVEDHVGNVCPASFYNYPSQELFSPGTVLIVKEPYFKIAADGMYSIRCDCMTDVLALRPSHPLFHLSKSVEWVNELRGKAIDPLTLRPVPSSALKWKERGNIFFDKNQLILAREAYFLGLETCKTEENSVNIEKVLKLNTLVVHLELGYYEKAIELGKEILEQFPDEMKALFRLGKAYYMVRKFDEAFKMYEKFCSKFPMETEGKDEFDRVKERLKERNGEFDVEKLRLMAKQDPLKEIDCADYEGPIEIKEISGKGRGLVLTKDVSKHTVLMISKALASTLNPAQNLSSILHEDNFEAGDFDIEQVVVKLVHMIGKNPNLFGPAVLALHMGPHSTKEPMQLFCDPGKQEPICNVKKIKAICEHNNFRIVNSRNGGGKGSGLFILPSYMNHSCELNVDYKFYNDVMVCTAMADLKAGTELTTSYINETWSYEVRTLFLNARGFKCQCNKCVRRI